LPPKKERKKEIRELEKMKKVNATGALLTFGVKTRQ